MTPEEDAAEGGLLVATVRALAEEVGFRVTETRREALQEIAVYRPDGSVVLVCRRGVVAGPKMFTAIRRSRVAGGLDEEPLGEPRLPHLDEEDR